MRENHINCTALPITLVIPPYQQDDANFKGEIRERFDEFIVFIRKHLA
jgi:hypothetical protein